MNNLAISLAVGASALFVTAASAAPLSADVSVRRESNIQNVRMVCNESGRCWRERSEGRVIIREPGDADAIQHTRRHAQGIHPRAGAGHGIHRGHADGQLLERDSGAGHVYAVTR